uniref:Uncharacterized protein n=1 Tax=Noctiluca scintillans TaxID=2966 RepID=A0A7S1F758_NOCSC
MAQVFLAWGNDSSCSWELLSINMAMAPYQPQEPGLAPQPYGQIAQPAGSQGVASSMQAIAQLFARLSQEIEEHQPKNCVHFIVDFLCKHYPEHLHGFAAIWQMDPDLERERHEVVDFFKAHKISTAVASHFTNAGYDTLDTLTTLSPDSLVDIEAFNNVKWLPGHKVRLQQIFGEISTRVRAFRQKHPRRPLSNADAAKIFAKEYIANMGVAPGRGPVVAQPQLALPMSPYIG